MSKRIQCSRCCEEVQRVFVEGMKDPITDVFFCDIHGLIHAGIEIID